MFIVQIGEVVSQFVSEGARGAYKILEVESAHISEVDISNIIETLDTS